MVPKTIQNLSEVVASCIQTEGESIGWRHRQQDRCWDLTFYPISKEDFTVELDPLLELMEETTVWMSRDRICVGGYFDGEEVVIDILFDLPEVSSLFPQLSTERRAARQGEISAEVIAAAAATDS